MPAKGSKGSGRSRAGGYHVKTGCLTCKIRHVKCDEEKPICYKCRSTGRVCDGYEAKPQAITKLDQQARTDRSLSVPIVRGLGFWTRGTQEERRSFDYFQSQTVRDLAFALNSSLDQLILQTSHHSDAVRHAAIALGSLGERIRLHHVVSQNALDANAQHRFSQMQYTKAVRSIRERIASDKEQAVDIVLLTCFLFIVFEFLQGNDVDATAHLRSGLNILRRCYFKESDSAKSKQSLRDLTSGASKLDPLRMDIVRVFQILDIQATVWLGLECFQDVPLTPLRPIPERPIRERFSSLDEAAFSLNIIITKIYHFRRQAAAHLQSPDPESIPSELQAMKQSLLDELEGYRIALRNFLSVHAGIETNPSNLDDPHRILILRINRKITTLMLSAFMQPPPRERYLYRLFAPQFRQIVSMATFLLRPVSAEMRNRLQKLVRDNNQATLSSGAAVPHDPPHMDYVVPVPFNSTSVPRQSAVVHSTYSLSVSPASSSSSSSSSSPPSQSSPTSLGEDSHQQQQQQQIFSFFAGVIQPLYYTAIKSRDREVVHKAIELLETEPWREGAWDSAVMARIASRKVRTLDEDEKWYDDDDNADAIAAAEGLDGQGVEMVREARIYDELEMGIRADSGVGTALGVGVAGEWP
ncbi:MAG: hypothetical protein Q9190_007418, partial [Brigantiaea leucoxantha]